MDAQRIPSCTGQKRAGVDRDQGAKEYGDTTDEFQGVEIKDSVSEQDGLLTSTVLLHSSSDLGVII